MSGARASMKNVWQSADYLFFHGTSQNAWTHVCRGPRVGYVRARFGWLDEAMGARRGYSGRQEGVSVL